jgi:hypothetical protein
MGYNFIWVTFSNGFSIELESGNWEQLRAYVKQCHKRGIKVAAYMSVCNMFADNMLSAVPESNDWLLIGKDGKPQPYGSANYKKIGRTTRVLADVSHPGWRDYLKKRIDAAIDIGVDAIEYDNIFFEVGRTQRAKERYQQFLEKNDFVDTDETRRMYGYEQRRRLFRELLAHARQRKSDMVIFHNDNYSHYVAARSDTIISTEDGKEPGYYDIDKYEHEVGASDLAEPVYCDVLDADSSQPFDPDHLVTNLGVLRLLKGLDEGWKPVLVEFGGRRFGHRLLNTMPPLSFQLSICECNAGLCAYQGYQEGRALLDLYRRKPEVMKIVAAAREAHDFVKKHQRYVVGAKCIADVALVLDDRIKGRDFWKYLPKENIQFEVLFEDRIKHEILSNYQRVLVYRAKLISDAAIAELIAYAESGGRMMVVGKSGQMDVWGQPRADNPLAGDGPWEVCPDSDDIPTLVGFLTEQVDHRFEIVNNPYILFTLTRHAGAGEGEYVVHLLNYLKTPQKDVRIRCPGASGIKVISLTGGCDRIGRGETEGEWVVPSLGLYSILLVK